MNNPWMHQVKLLETVTPCAGSKGSQSDCWSIQTPSGNLCGHQPDVLVQVLTDCRLPK